MVNKLLMVGQQIKHTSMVARKPFRIMVRPINTDIVSGLQQIMVNGTAEGSIINGGSQVVNEGGLAEKLGA
ncbi:ABC transporter ATP-binding protein [Escherichia coli]|uniref:ABC transporter ATP-binding protein n=1 Tax=Escherichia coli TaxID=562 RepID=A0A377AHL2_ECOLX|nr:ABC transporter ATP-binding protein [Escherichia coli]